MKISARNVLPGKVKQSLHGTANFAAGRSELPSELWRKSRLRITESIPHFSAMP